MIRIESQRSGVNATDGQHGNTVRLGPWNAQVVARDQTVKRPSRRLIAVMKRPIERDGTTRRGINQDAREEQLHGTSCLIARTSTPPTRAGGICDASWVASSMLPASIR